MSIGYKIIKKIPDTDYVVGDILNYNPEQYTVGVWFKLNPGVKQRFGLKIKDLEEGQKRACVMLGITNIEKLVQSGYLEQVKLGRIEFTGF